MSARLTSVSHSVHLCGDRFLYKGVAGLGDGRDRFPANVKPQSSERAVVYLRVYLHDNGINE